MWEAAAIPGRGAELLDWVRATAADELGETSDIRVYCSSDDRVVLIASSKSHVRPRIQAEPTGLVRRPPHQWLFREVGSDR
ncbi:hypothetical protein NRB20_34190 [Nocardia sp. RB20]|uniref:Uncharacterized protein n=2 Tax=Nocardia macrotermitis TaxID=2585198 RepID=A0A7K0D3R5_9NOCA|nr:hypothetical protein [Nocardia macrotermitis]